MNVHTCRALSVGLGIRPSSPEQSKPKAAFPPRVDAAMLLRQPGQN